MQAILTRALLFSLLTALSSSYSMAQYNLIRTDNVPVTDGDLLKYAWMGGLNCPQFNSIDLNGDNIEDLVVFNRGSSDNEVGRNGHKWLTFINNGTPNQIDYTYAPQYEAWFPGVQQWALLRDFNCDGIKDIITYQIGQVHLWYGANNGGVLSWTFSDTLKYMAPNGVREIFVSSIDIPAVDDIDNDGDLDILTFKQSGFLIDYFQNRSMETNGTCNGNMVFEHVSDCWGEIWEEGLSNAVNFDSCGTNKRSTGNTQATGQNRHAGSTLCTYDEDGDGDKDLILGDISFPRINRVINGGDSSYAYIVAQDSAFPSYDVSYNLEIFPAAFYQDVNNDGRGDLIVAPNSPRKSENINCAWLYLDVGTTDTVDFELLTDSFLVSDAIDFGEGAYPAFFDYNADGLMDLVIGNYGDFESPNFYKSGLALFENTGTTTQPAFTLIDDDWLDISDLIVDNTDIRGVAPAFGDIDGDGDVDMFIGDETGQLHFYTNTAGPGNPANLTLTDPLYASIDVGQHSTPHLYDVNRDGVLDLLIGKDRGEIHYFENRGSSTNPQFDAVPDSYKFGNVDVGLAGFLGGFSVPYVHDLGTGNPFLLVGSEFGVIEVYYIDQSKLYSGEFVRVSAGYAGVDGGERMTMAMADIDDDGKDEVVLGNYRGGVSFYDMDSFGSYPFDVPGYDTVRTGLIDLNAPTGLWASLYPNPANKQVTVQLDKLPTEAVSIELYDLSGKKLITQQSRYQKLISLDVAALSRGLYFVHIAIGKQRTTQRLIVE